MKNILKRMQRAVWELRGVRLSDRETKKIVSEFKEKELVFSDELKDLREKSDMASSYLEMRRCKACKKLKLDGYVCPCGVDDTAPREEQAT